MPNLPSLHTDTGSIRGDTPLRQQGRPHGLAIALAAGLLTAVVGWGSGVMNGSSGPMPEWQAQLSNGLEISMRAVADGRDTLVDDAAAVPVKVVGASWVPQARPVAIHAISVSTDRQLQPTR